MWFNKLRKWVKRMRSLTRSEQEALILWLLDEKSIHGSIRSSIHAHGNVTYANSSSAAKRVRGSLKARAKLWRKRSFEGKP